LLAGKISRLLSPAATKQQPSRSTNVVHAAIQKKIRWIYFHVVIGIIPKNKILEKPPNFVPKTFQNIIHF